MASAITSRLSGMPLVLFLDIDGTLSPIAPRPEYAIVPPDTQRLLNELADVDNVHVVVVTGRSAQDGRRLVCVDKAWVIGNHGIEVAPPGAPAAARDDIASFAPVIAESVERAQRIASTPERNGVLVEDKRWTVSVHYRLAHPRIVPELTADIQQLANDLGLRMTSGKEVLELRPPLDVDKGSASVDLAETLGAAREGASLLAAGDDRTDEDMFRALRAHQSRAVTIRVGADLPGVETGAEFSVADTEAMRELLAAVLTLRRALSRR
jgi:trehalose-phosphatase